jgi:hypothetical protein
MSEKAIFISTQTWGANLTIQGCLFQTILPLMTALHLSTSTIKDQPRTQNNFSQTSARHFTLTLS